jgi:predicted aspartyl protease
VKGHINGKPMLALVDTGAFNSLVWRGAADEYELPVRPLRGVLVSGVGGTREAQATSIKELRLGSSSRRNINVLMTGSNRPLGRQNVAMIIGQDILSHADVEFDLGKGVIRFLKPVGCGPNDSLAYWGGAFAEAPIERVTPDTPHVITTAQVNGRTVRAMLDTGAWTTVLSEHSARQAGVKESQLTESVRTSGVGSRSVATYLGTFDRLTIGNQTINKPKLRVSDLWKHSRRTQTGSRLSSAADSDDPDLIIGADFFRSHRVLISYSQRRIYFTHQGGAIFQTEGPPLEAEESSGD